MALRRRGRVARSGAFGDDDDRTDVDPPDVDPPVDLSLDVVDEITWYMREHRVSRADLAGAMGVSPGRLSQILSGGEGLTPRALGTVLAALGARIDITVRPVTE